jgi:hypothetical protein
MPLVIDPEISGVGGRRVADRSQSGPDWLVRYHVTKGLGWRTDTESARSTPR